MAPGGFPPVRGGISAPRNANIPRVYHIHSEKRSSGIELNILPRKSSWDKEGSLLREKISSCAKNHHSAIGIVIPCCKKIPLAIGRYPLGPIFSGNPPLTGKLSLLQEDRFLSVVINKQTNK